MKKFLNGDWYKELYTLKKMKGMRFRVPLLSGEIIVKNSNCILPEDLYMGGLHSHTTTEFFFCFRGEIAMEIDGEQILFGENEVLIITPGIRHALDIAMSKSTMALVLNVEYEGERYDESTLLEYAKEEEELLKHLWNKRFQKLKLSERTLREVYMLVDCLNTNYIADYIKVRGYMGSIFISLAQASCGAKKSPVFEELVKKDESENKIHVIETYIIDHLTEDINIATIAAMLNYTPRHVQRIVTKFFHASFSEVVLHYRLSMAKQLLCFTDKSLEIIGEESGFGNSKTMYKNFKKITGLSPNQYRKKMQRLLN